jgi:hypothetical protein
MLSRVHEKKMKMQEAADTNQQSPKDIQLAQAKLLHVEDKISNKITQVNNRLGREE